MPGTKRFRHNSPSDSSDDVCEQNVSKKGNPNPQTPQCRAARVRRNKEMDVMALLSEALPIPKTVSKGLDKASVLRMAISYIKMKKIISSDQSEAMQEFLLNNNSADTQVENLTHNQVHGNQGNFTHNSRDDHHLHNISNGIREADMMLKSMYGFLLFVGKKGDIYFASEQVAQHIGHNQVDLVGKNIYSFLHKDDCKEFYKQFRSHPTCQEDVFKESSLFPTSGPFVDYNRLYEDDDEDDDDDEVDPSCYVCERLFYARMRCHIKKKGIKTKQTGFMLMQFTGRVRLEKRRVIGMTLICRPMQSSPIVEIRLDGNMFMTRHSLDLRFTFIDPRIITLVGYEPEELIGKTAYQLHNPVDAKKCLDCHDNLIAHGTAVSKYYRFLGKTGVWVWMQTRATIIYNTGNKPQYVACMNYIIGEEEGRRYLMMEQEEQGMKAANDPGFIDITSFPSSPSSPDTGYVSGSDYDHQSPESLSPAMLSPSASTQDTAGLVNNQSYNNLLDDIILPDFLDDAFSPAQSIGINSRNASGESVNTMAPVSPNFILPPKSNMSGISTHNSMAQMTNNFDPEMVMDVEQNNEKSITITLPATACSNGLSAQIMNALKNVPIQTQGGQPNIQISIETTSVKSQRPQMSMSSPSQQTFSQSSTGKCINIPVSSTSMNVSDNFPVSMSDNFPVSMSDNFPVSMSGTSPGTEAMMEMSVDFPGNKLVENVSQKMSESFDLFSSPDLMESQLLDYDVLNISDTNLADNLLNDVSLGTTVDTVPMPSFSSTRTSPSMQYTEAARKPVTSPSKAMPPPGKKPHLIHIPQQNNMLFNKTDYRNQNGTHVYPNNTSKKVNTNVYQNGTNTANSQYNNCHKIDFEAAKRGLDDHSYTAKCPSKNNGQHVKFASSGTEKKRTRQEGTLLEHFLTTDKPLNPMRGSDCVAQSISKLKIEDSHHGSKRTQKPTLLKKLLTEDKIDSDKTNHASTSRGNQPSTSASQSSSVLPETSCVIPPVFGEPAVTDLNILDSGPDMDDSVWNDLSKEETDELYLSSEINEILEQENWLQEEWMKHFLEKLL